VTPPTVQAPFFHPFIDPVAYGTVPRIPGVLLSHPMVFERTFYRSPRFPSTAAGHVPLQNDLLSFLMSTFCFTPFRMPYRSVVDENFRIPSSFFIFGR